MRILSVNQIKDIEIDNGIIFPLNNKTRIILDKTNPSNKKEHQLIYHQSLYYGSVGDRCRYLNNDELFDLEKRGFITIKKTK